MAETMKVSRRTVLKAGTVAALSAGSGQTMGTAAATGAEPPTDQAGASRFDQPGSPSRRAERAWAEDEYSHYQRMRDPNDLAQQGSPTAPQFSQTKNAVKDYGADPKGNRPISEDIPSTIPDGTVIVFPPGTYLVPETWQIEAEGVGGIVGAGYKQASSPPKPGKQAATFVAAGNSRTQIQFIAQTGLFANVVLDQTRTNNSMGMVLETDGFGQIRDVRYVGTQDNTGEGVADKLEIPLCALRATREQATVRAERVIGQYVGLPSDKESGGAPFFWVGSSHKGTAQMGHCVIQGAADNGLYGGRTPGKAQVKGGKYVNNAVSQLRFSGKGSWIDGATLVVDAKNYKGPAPGQGFNDKFGTHGIKVERGNEAPNKPSGAVVRNTDIRLLSEGDQGVGAGVRVRGSGGALKIENSRLVNNLECPSIIAEAPGEGYSGATAPPPHNITITHSLFAGTNAEVMVRERANSLVSKTCFQVSGASSESVSGMRLGQAVGFGKKCKDKAGLKNPKKVGSPGKLPPVPELPGDPGGPGNGTPKPNQGNWIAKIAAGVAQVMALGFLFLTALFGFIILTAKSLITGD